MLRAAVIRSASSSSARSCEVDRSGLGRPWTVSGAGAGEGSLPQSAENSGAYSSICFSRSRRGAPSRPPMSFQSREKQTVCQEIQTELIQGLALRPNLSPRASPESTELALALHRKLSRAHDRQPRARGNYLNMGNLVCRQATTSVALSQHRVTGAA